MHRICNHFANYTSVRILDRQLTCIVHAIFIDQTKPPECARPPQYVSSTQKCLARSNSIVHMQPLSLSRAETNNGLQPVPVISSLLSPVTQNKTFIPMWVHPIAPLREPTLPSGPPTWQAISLEFPWYMNPFLTPVYLFPFPLFLLLLQLQSF